MAWTNSATASSQRSLLLSAFNLLGDGTAEHRMRAGIAGFQANDFSRLFLGVLELALFVEQADKALMRFQRLWL